MKSLAESIFDKDLVTKDLFTDHQFKKWINKPDVLWYIYNYWEADFEDPLEDFYPEEWELYKESVDVILKIINDAMKKDGAGKGSYWHWIRIDTDWAETDSVKDWAYTEEDESDFEYDLMDAMYEIHRNATDVNSDVYKTWFKGPLPKNSKVTYLVNMVFPMYTKRYHIDGGIFLALADDVMAVLAFPRGVDKSVRKIFDL